MSAVVLASLGACRLPGNILLLFLIVLLRLNLILLPGSCKAVSLRWCLLLLLFGLDLTLVLEVRELLAGSALYGLLPSVAVLGPVCLVCCWVSFSCFACC